MLLVNFLMMQKSIRASVAVAILSTQLAVATMPADAQPQTGLTSNHALDVAPLNPISVLPPAPQQDAWASGSTQKPSERWQGFIERALDASQPDLSKSATALPASKTAPAVSTAPAPKPPTVPARSVNQPLRGIAQGKTLTLPLKNARIVVWKSQRRLELFDGNQLVKTYRVALGNQPQGHKQRQGDGRTPEGQYFICTRNAQTSAFHIFLGLSYPALPDATKGVNNKAITWREYQVIRQRLASRSAPLWRTRLGGWVGIHGGSDASFAQRKTRERGSSDWTAGCIALTNAEIREIYAATKMGTPVLVKP